MSKTGFSVPADFVTHCATGVAGLTALLLAQFLSPVIAALVGLVLVSVGAMVATGLLRNRTRNGLAIVENAVIKGEQPVGTSVYHETAVSVVTHISRLAAVASKGREQSREVEALLTAFDRRSRDGNGNSSPSQQLTRLLRSLGNNSRITIQKIGNMERGLDVVSQNLGEIGQDQYDLVRAAAREVDSLAKSVETIHLNAKEAGSCDSSTDRVVDRVTSGLLDFQKQLDTLRELLTNCDKKSHFLRDQTTEIASLLQSIVEHSARTDTMALNASIESVRAGEHGRGFAAAADEIRKLTGIISESTQSVLERLKVVESSAGEASELCTDGQGTLETQLNVARDVTQAMTEIRETNQKSRERLEKVVSKSSKQMDHITEVAKTLDGLLGCRDRGSLQLEEGAARRRDLRGGLAELDMLLEPLVPNGRAAAPAAADQGPPAATTGSDTVDLEVIDLAGAK